MDSSRYSWSERVRAAVLAVLPPGAEVATSEESDRTFSVTVAGHAVRAVWIPRGLSTEIPDDVSGIDVLVAPAMTGPARAAAERRGVGWVDETGAASFMAGPVVVVRPGNPPAPQPTGDGSWTSAVEGVTECLLTGTQPTVSATAAATGLSNATTTRALRVLTNEGLLQQKAARGPDSGRRLVDPDALLAAYVDHVTTRRGRHEGMRVAVEPRALWRRLEQADERWRADGRTWALTGPLAAALLAPFLSEPTPWAAYVDVGSRADLTVAANSAGFRASETGRLMLQPFPSPATAALTASARSDDLVLPVAPWPRVYADLWVTGVRGKEAADHLREVVETT